MTDLLTGRRPRWIPDPIWAWLTRPDLGRCRRHDPEPIVPGGPSMCLNCGVVA